MLKLRTWSELPGEILPRETASRVRAPYAAKIGSCELLKEGIAEAFDDLQVSE